MIELATDDPVLARFVRDLEGQASIALEDEASAGPELARYTAEDIEHAQLAWSHRVMGEYRGVVIYTELLSALIEAEAPYPALAAVHRVIGDELRHTRLCAEVVMVGTVGAEDLGVVRNGHALRDGIGSEGRELYTRWQ